ncbi:hypothetical protein Dimus_003706 [Dionaea muscipula]
MVDYLSVAERDGQWQRRTGRARWWKKVGRGRWLPSSQQKLIGSDLPSPDSVSRSWIGKFSSWMRLTERLTSSDLKNTNVRLTVEVQSELLLRKLIHVLGPTAIRH